MARPERRDVDYFPFYVKDGRTLYILENKYGCKGTGFFTNVLRVLATTPDHYFSIEDESDRMMFFAKCKCENIDDGMDMLEIMAKTGKIDKELFRRKHVIASEDFLISIQDAYRKRHNSCVSIGDIKCMFSLDPPEERGKTPEETPQNVDNGGGKGDNSGDNPQSKVKESKVNNIYDFYSTKIDPEQKTSQRAKSNINHWLKYFSDNELIASIKNYSTLALKRSREHRKDPANFFQKREPAFKDYLSDVFKPPQGQKPLHQPGNPQSDDPYFCKVCGKKKNVMARPGLCADCASKEENNKLKNLVNKIGNGGINGKRK